MPNEFDDFEASLHYEVAETFGYSASWLPASGGPAQVITVCFQDPNGRGGITETQYLNYEDEEPVIEYYQGQFPGLAESVNGSNQVEVLEVTKGQRIIRFHVTRCKKVIDGDTFHAKLRFISERPV